MVATVALKTPQARQFYASQAATNTCSVLGLRQGHYQGDLEVAILRDQSSREQVALLQMHQDSTTVAEYWTELPPKAELEQHLHQALIEARERLARRGVLLEGGDDE